MANELVTLPKRMADKFYEVMDKVPGPKKNTDTSWHKKMVKEANESFRKPEKSKAQRKVQGKLPTISQGKIVKTAGKTGARKRSM